LGRVINRTVTTVPVNSARWNDPLVTIYPRRNRPGQAWIGALTYDAGARGLRLQGSSVPGTPAYAAGLDRGDEITEFGGTKIESEQQLADVLRAHRPGDTLRMSVTDRAGVSRAASITVAEDPRIEVVPVEQTGGRLSAAQRAFRRQWLESHQ